MAMTSYEQMRLRAALEALAEIDTGLSARVLGLTIELATGRPCTDVDVDKTIRHLREKRLITSYTNRVTDEVTWCITDLGRVALAGQRV